MIRDTDLNLSLSAIIPDRFYEEKDVDWYGRLITNTYIKQKDGTFKKGRLANLKAGNIFKLIDPTKEKIDDVNIPEYRALKDCMFCETQDNVVVYATLYAEYKQEVELPPYKFEPPNPNKLCRG